MTVCLSIAPTLWTITVDNSCCPSIVGGGLVAYKQLLTYKISSQQFWNLGAVTYYHEQSDTTDTIVQDQAGAGNGNAWQDFDTGSYHGTIHGGENDVTLWADLDGRVLTSTDVGEHVGSEIVVYRTSNLYGQYWTWEWRLAFHGWYEKFTQTYPTAVANYLTGGYTGMLCCAGDFTTGRKDGEAAVPLPYIPGGENNIFFEDLTTLYLMKALDRITLKIGWHALYPASGSKNFVQMRDTSQIAKYYPRRPVLAVGETRVYERTIEVLHS